MDSARLDALLTQVGKMADRVDALCAARHDAEWNEADHPRAEDGKFGAGAGSHMKPAEGSGKERKALGGKELPEHIKALKLPPAWTDVHFSEDPAAPLQAIGRDAKGRAQYVYSKAFIETQSAKKFARIKDLDQQLTEIESQNNKARRDPRKREAADCAALIMNTGIRPGSEDDTGAKAKAYGATTLEGRHVVETAGCVRLVFVGKKGVNIDIRVDDKEIAVMLLERKQIAGSGGPLFSINETALLSYVHSLDHGRFKTKDFRTLLGTKTAMREVEKLSTPKDEKDYKKRVMDVAKTVAARLGNTAVVALQSYIAPEVFSAWRMQ